MIYPKKKRLEVIRAVASGGKPEDVAKEHGVHVSTVYNWLPKSKITRTRKTNVKMTGAPDLMVDLPVHPLELENRRLKEFIKAMLNI